MKTAHITEGDKVLSSIYVADSLVQLTSLVRQYEKAYLLCDRNVADGGLKGLLDQLAAEDNVQSVKKIEAKEAQKSMDTVLDICSWLMENEADRKALLVAIGGGITTDMAGFAASIYKRGIRFAYVPTTLLAQVDAAMGGKTGVNFGKYKNMLGVIRQPEFTFSCPDVLETLPKEDFLSGAAEMLKTFIIEDNGNYDEAVRLLTAMVKENAEWPDVVKNYKAELQEMIFEAARVKAGVVSRDQFESGERRKLNLGHTFAHAIETIARRREDSIPHGRAVAIGMVYAAELSERLSIAEKGFAEKIKADMKGSEVLSEKDVADGGYATEEMEEIMQKDKKAEGSKVHFVLPVKVGEVITKELTVAEAVGLLKA